MTTRSLIVVLAASLALAGCGDDKTPAAEGNASNKARGEVLGGTINDAMLPLDSVTSQSPPLREDPTEGASTTSGGGDQDEGAAATSETPAEGAAEGEGETAPASEPAEAETPAGE